MPRRILVGILAGALIGGCADKNASAPMPVAENVFASSKCSSSAQAIGNKGYEGTIVANKVFFRATELSLDFDGSPRAYGVRDQGEEGICNGLAPSTGACRGKFQGSCFKVCNDTFAAWSNAGADVSRLGETMCSIGLGGMSCSVPDARLQPAPRQAWFVSETSLKTSPPDATPPNWVNSQNAQLDPAIVRYLVIPGALRKAPWGVKFGDVGMAISATTSQLIPFIVGDGGNLGEGSVSLLADLRPDKPPMLTDSQSALGEPVKRYQSGIIGDFKFIIFKGTAELAGSGPPRTKATAASLMSWVRTTASSHFQTESNRAEVDVCAGQNSPGS